MCVCEGRLLLVCGAALAALSRPHEAHQACRSTATVATTACLLLSRSSCSAWTTLARACSTATASCMKPEHKCGHSVRNPCGQAV